MIPEWTGQDAAGVVLLVVGLGHLLLAFHYLDKTEPVKVLLYTLLAGVSSAAGVLLIAIPPS